MIHFYLAFGSLCYLVVGWMCPPRAAAAPVQQATHEEWSDDELLETLEDALTEPNFRRHNLTDPDESEAAESHWAFQELKNRGTL